MRSQKVTALFAIGIANVLVQLSMIPISAILPTIAAYFKVEITTASWVMTAYLLTLTSFVLIGGRLGDLYGHRQIFIFGSIVYTIAGSLSGLVQDIGLFIALRAVQGFGVAMFSGVSMAIIAHTFTAQERGKAIGLAGTAASAGGLFGVLASTSLAQFLNWQFLFFLNLPLGLIALKAGLDLRLDYRPAERPRVDYLGAVLLATALTAFSLSLSHLHPGEGTFSAGWYYHVGLVLVTVVSLFLFVTVERHAPQPMVKLSHLANGSFSASCVANEVLHMTMMASTFLMPFLLERGLGFAPMYTAGLLMITRVGNLAIAPISGMIYDRTHWRFLCPVAMTGICIGLATMAFFAPTLPYPSLLLVILLLGLSLGFFLTPNNTIIMSTVPPELRGFAAGMLETSRQLGHTLGVSFSSAVMSVSLAGLAYGTPENTAYIIGYQNATLAGASVAFLGILAALVHARSPEARAASGKRLAKAS